MKNKIKILLILLIILSGIDIYLKFNTKEKYYVDSDNIIHHENRPKIEFTRQLVEDRENYTKEKIIINSKETKIYGYLFLRKLKGKVPGVIFLPAAQATKEGAATESKIFLKNGFAVLTIAQRGIGETDGYVPGIEQDYNNFINNRETTQSLMVYDALRLFDIFNSIENIDKNKIVISGESMGGRTAIIAGGIEKKIKGVLIISSSGYESPKKNNETANNFLDSINPNNYIYRISPRKLIMIHSENDTVIPIKDAEYTFSLAKEPKEFIKIKNCNHGYCDEMSSTINESLNNLII